MENVHRHFCSHSVSRRWCDVICECVSTKWPKRIKRRTKGKFKLNCLKKDPGKFARNWAESAPTKTVSRRTGFHPLEWKKYAQLNIDWRPKQEEWRVAFSFFARHARKLYFTYQKTTGSTQSRNIDRERSIDVYVCYHNASIKLFHLNKDLKDFQSFYW